MTEQRDTLAVLEANGFAINLLTEGQRRILAALTPAELELIIDIKTRLDELGPDVEAHSDIAGGALF